jgi:hypothetical protein
MADVTQEQIAASESAVPEPQSETPPEGAPVAADTTEQVAETDEQKNARELAEQRERSEKRAKGVQKRFDELTRDKYDAHARADRAERMLEQVLSRGPQPGTPQPAAPKEPTREQFANYDDWISAKAEYVADQRAAKIVEERFQRMQQGQNDTAQQYEIARIRNDFAARQQEFAKKTPDYFEKVQTEDVRVPHEAAAYLQTMEDAPAVMYHMANNPEIAARLWNQPPLRQAMLLGELSAQLRTNPQVSTAPPPGKPTGARSGPSNEPPQDMEGYLKWRAKQRSAKNV